MYINNATDVENTLRLDANANANANANVVNAANTEKGGTIDEGLRKEIERKLNEQLELWNAFRQTRQGQIITELSENYIRALTMELAKPATAFDLPLDKIQEMRAEWRGELRAWWRIRYYPNILENQLKEVKAAK